MKKTENELLDKEIKNDENVKEDKLVRGKRYVGYFSRLTTYIVLSLIFVILSVAMFVSSASYQKQSTIQYTENSDIDYKVYLKKNDFFEKEYLNKDMIYIANLIDSINVDFVYDFSIEDDVNMEFTYDIIGELVISEASSDNVFFKKEYVLKEANTHKIENNTKHSILENVSIDYDYYNELANNFKSAYRVESDSNLNVFLRINKKLSESDGVVKCDDSNTMKITIPLTEKAINIGMNYNEINNSDYILGDSELSINDSKTIALSIIFALVALLFIFKTIKLLLLLKNKKSVYDKYVSKLLTEYDRLVVETVTNPTIDMNTVIKLKKFDELLDVRDNLKLPIMYYSVVPHQKSYFYIKSNDSTYLFVVKAVDLEVNQ